MDKEAETDRGHVFTEDVYIDLDEVACARWQRTSQGTCVDVTLKNGVVQRLMYDGADALWLAMKSYSTAKNEIASSEYIERMKNE